MILIFHLLSTPAQLHIFHASQQVATNFISRAASLPPVAKVHVLDVGANNGKWAESMMKLLTAAAPHVNASLTMVEPQPKFIGLLNPIAHRWNGTFLPLAGWHTAGATLTFHRSRLDQAASVHAPMAQLFGALGTIKVRTLDLPRLVERLAGSAELLFAKIDIEGAEYDVLPALLARGALCRVHYLLLEFHLNALEERRRLGGVALRLSLNETLRGCEVPPREVVRPPPPPLSPPPSPPPSWPGCWVCRRLAVATAVVAWVLGLPPPRALAAAAALRLTLSRSADPWSHPLLPG